MLAIYHQSTWHVVDAFISVVVDTVLLFRRIGVGRGLDGELGRGVKENGWISGLSPSWVIVTGPEMQEARGKQGLRGRKTKILVVDTLV